MLCDAVLRRITLDDRGVPINVGRRYRTATDAQWAATKAIYDSCGWDQVPAADQLVSTPPHKPLGRCRACSAGAKRVRLRQTSGGRTDLCQMVPLCSHHHHLVHDGGWSIGLLDDRRLEIYRPDGQLYAMTPPPTRRPVQHE